MPSSTSHVIQTAQRDTVVCHLGRMGYDEAWSLQQKIQARLIDVKRGNLPMSRNVLLTVEHPPVYTLGKSGNPENLLASESDLAEHGATFVHTDRGGDITFHGPGQLVGYPILDLDRFFTDIGRYLRKLEQVLIRACAHYDIAAERVAGRTGVWLGVGTQRERKIGAMGIRCSRWVTMHGFALNVNTDLRYFDRIVPCGIADRAVTSIAAEVGHPVDPIACRDLVIALFGEEFEARLETISPDLVKPFIETVTKRGWA